MKWFKMYRQSDKKTVVLPLVEGGDVVSVPTSTTYTPYTLDNTPVSFTRRQVPVFVGVANTNPLTDYTQNFIDALSYYYTPLDFSFFANQTFIIDEMHKITFSDTAYHTITFEYKPSGDPISTHTFNFTFGTFCGTIPYWDEELEEKIGESQFLDWSVSLKIYPLSSNLDTPQSWSGNAENKSFYPFIARYQGTHFNAFWHNVDDMVFVDEPDPYTPAGGGSGDPSTGSPTTGSPTSDTDPEASGGNGTQNIHSDPIPLEPIIRLPDVSDLGFVKIYSPSSSELNSLATYMWSNTFDLNTLKKIFANPIDSVISLGLVPITIPSGGISHIFIGNIDTGINCTIAGQQYIDVDCGTIEVEEFYGSFMDYSPYTKCEIYLPFIGYKTLDVDMIMRKSINVTYRVDILTGSCVANVICNNSVIAQYVGNCLIVSPFTGSNFNAVFSGLVSLTQAGLGVISGGVLAGATGGILNGVVQGIGSTINQSGSIVGEVMSTKPQIEKSGAISSHSGLLGVLTPHLIITRPRTVVPENQNTLNGYPCLAFKNFSDISGFTVVQQTNLKGIPCSEAELQKITNLLYQGVVF